MRRSLRRGRRQVGDIGVQAEEQLDQHLFKRLTNLASVRRFVIGWIMLMLLLCGGVIYQITVLADKYEGTRPLAGGIYTEGMVGVFTNANPMYAVSPVDAAVSKLLFGGLLKYDQSGQLAGDLAIRWSVDETGKIYKVVLRPDILWHDGTKLTAEDVVYTYQTIQNPDAKSPLWSAWQGVTVEARDDRTILFTLPNVLASFPYALTNGIVPKHILGSTPAAQLRSIQFDTVSPIGSGPFKWGAIQVTGQTPESRQTQIALSPNDTYYNGAPQLDQFRIHTFGDEASMIASFDRQELTAMSGLGAMPGLFANDLGVKDYSVPYMGEVGVFFKTSAPNLTDVKVRQALVQSINHQATLIGLPYPVSAVRGPLLKTQLGYVAEAQQLSLNLAKSAELLDAAGWTMGTNGIRQKDGKPLLLTLFAQDTDELGTVVERLSTQWQAIGVKIDAILQSDEELQKTVSERNYDMLLYGISLGADPDVFAYWHSSQANAVSANRLNFSEYKSAIADLALESGRTRIDPSLRAVKYRPFLDAWRTDAPALMLYQPRYLYISRGEVRGFEPMLLNASTDRLANVEHWTIRQAKTAE